MTDWIGRQKGEAYFYVRRIYARVCQCQRSESDADKRGQGQWPESGRGVQIWSCGTCLDYFSLKEKLQVGEVTNMYNATEALLNASKTMVF